MTDQAKKKLRSLATHGGVAGAVVTIFLILENTGVLSAMAGRVAGSSELRAPDIIAAAVHQSATNAEAIVTHRLDEFGRRFEKMADKVDALAGEQRELIGELRARRNQGT